MAFPNHSQPDDSAASALPPELTEQEKAVLKLLETERTPMDTIQVASACRLSVDDALAILHSLRDKGLVGEAGVEPVRERYAVDRKAVAAALS